jgi:hypothetical protein
MYHMYPYDSGDFDILWASQHQAGVCWTRCITPSQCWDNEGVANRSLSED